MRANELEFTPIQEKRHPHPPEKQPLTQSKLELVGNVPLPLSLSFFMMATKSWDKGALICVLMDESVFGIAFQLLVFKDDITQLYSMQHIGVVPLTLYMR